MDKKRIDFLLFCDDVREEVSGKLSIIGVYKTNYFVPSFPFEGRVAVFMGVKMEEEGIDYIYFDYFIEGKEKPELELRVEISTLNISKGEVLQIHTPPLPFKIDGKASLLFREKTEDGEILQEFPLEIDLNPNASERPSEQSPSDAPATD